MRFMRELERGSYEVGKVGRGAGGAGGGRAPKSGECAEEVKIRGELDGANGSRSLMSIVILAWDPGGMDPEVLGVGQKARERQLAEHPARQSIVNSHQAILSPCTGASCVKPPSPERTHTPPPPPRDIHIASRARGSPCVHAHRHVRLVPFVLSSPLLPTKELGLGMEKSNSVK